MTEDGPHGHETPLEITQQKSPAREKSSIPSYTPHQSHGDRIKEGINPFWPVLLILVLLGGTTIAAVFWLTSRVSQGPENEIAETTAPTDSVRVPMLPAPNLESLPHEPMISVQESTPPSTLPIHKEVEESPTKHMAGSEQTQKTLSVSELSPQIKTSEKENEPRPAHSVQPTSGKRFLDGPMIKKPDPPSALLSALAMLDKDNADDAIAIITTYAEADWPEAQTALGLAMAKGKALPQDFTKSIEYLREAAAQDHALAQFYLGQAYLNGTGVKPDPIQAIAWFILAASHGHAAAQIEKDRRLATLSPSDRHSAFIRVGNLGPKVHAGWGHDPKHGTAVWLPSWYRTGSYSLQVEVPATNGYAQGQGTVILKASLPGDSDRTFEGHFSEGYYFGDLERKSEFHFLPTNDFLYRLPASQHQAYREGAFWLRVDYGVDFAANPCYVATNRTPDLLMVMPENVPVLDDEAAKGAMREAWEIYLDTCPKNFHVKLTLVPQTFGFGKNRFGHRIFVPQLATGSFYGKKGETFTASNFVNHAKRENEKAQRALTRQQQRQEREKKKRQAAAAAKTRGTPDIRGIRLDMTLAELHAHLEDEIAAVKPPWNPGKPLPEFRQFEQTIHLTDGSRLSASFTSPGNGSVLYAMVYEQDLRTGPKRATLITDLETKYGQPDDKGTGGIWWSYQLVSRVNEGLGAFMKIHYRMDRETDKVEYLRLIVNDAGFGSYDKHTAYDAKRQAKQEAFEASKSDKPTF